MRYAKWIAGFAVLVCSGCDFVLPVDAAAISALVAAILALLNQAGGAL